MSTTADRPVPGRPAPAPGGPSLSGPSGPSTAAAPGEQSPQTVDRGVVIGAGVASLSRWSIHVLIIVVAIGVLWWLLGKAWVGLFPVILALVVTSILAPPAAWLRRHGVPGALAAALVLLGAIGLVGGTLGAIAPQVVDQSVEIANNASQGLADVQERLQKEPFGVDSATVDDGVAQARAWLNERGGKIASGVFTGVTRIGSALVTLVLVLVLTFFFLKDGPRFLPFVRATAGRTAGRHLAEVLARSWQALGGFIRVQAIVSAIDAVLIGGGLAILGVPLALALGILTFFGGFIPIVGAFTVGALAVLVALVTKSVTTALLVLALIVVVQQIEGNVLQPMLQSRSMDLHAGVVLLAVAAGGTVYGIVGAFLAVPAAAVGTVILRYLNEQIALRTGELHAGEVRTLTRDGQITAQEGEQAAASYAADAAVEEIAAEDAAARVADQQGAGGLVGTVAGRVARVRARMRPHDRG